MIATSNTDHKTAAEMSVVARNLELRNEVNTMTVSTINTARSIRSSADYGLAERLAASVALALLRWSNRRTIQAQPSHECVTRLLENQRVIDAHTRQASTFAVMHRR